MLAALLTLAVQDWHPQAPPLPPPSGPVIRAATADELYRATAEVPPGGTILLEDGRYELPAFLVLAKDGVTLRSASGRRDRVILDGTNNRHGELVGLKGTGITVADLTIQNVKWNGFKIVETGTHRALIWNCVIRNVWQRGVKASAVPREKPELSPRDCRVQFCLFVNERAKRHADDEADPFDGNYIGGMDVKNTVGWTISDNVFLGLQGRTREGRAAIYVSENGRDGLIERNVIADCDVGIALGNPSLGYSPLQAVGWVVRNNLVTRCPETGILADYTKDCVIAHNTIHDPGSRLQRLILIQDLNENLRVTCNLLSGPPIRNRTERGPVLEGNVVAPDLSEYFADAAAGNLRLRRAPPGVADAGERLALVSHDVDHQPRLDRPDAGADELRRP